ncbi:flagellar hook protein FlgE [Sulfitobacter donghicola]|uniref:Flagellar hook protein FlgE n=1 Tax=Sulfitobacter donghicola DSW-25 = KCTC 12864 = JCM 14565 TaxID=1300350 RepID=A0A073ILD8_9RHOB|nr:flagellar hook-basal body complex protein [Sulfitobacter donghicola]KEJ90534.1 flagellar hook protein FlgE [Sulfitobacter donghicola DSW-25 = KCTC 12864 = JCM 14565]KIN67776.1 Flagellar hook protein FlgE [Sulfitobacter donghicola DSW-25 = KCTC 12864 = JCM 14565]
MTISSSLNAGVAGLQANATKLASISDNIANSSTFGYKRVQTDFESVVISGNGENYTAGGVRATTERDISLAGSLASSSNSTDLAVRGNGFLPVAQLTDLNAGTGEPQMLLTSTGSFNTDENGYLTTSSGIVLLGWPANPDGSIPTNARDMSTELEPVQINVNQLTGEPTTRVTLGVNLPATGTIEGADGEVLELPVEYFDNLGISESINISFTPTVPTAAGSPASNEWTMTITDSVDPTVTIGEYVLTFADDRTSGGTLASVTTVSGGAYDAATGDLIVNVAGGPLEIQIGVVGQSDAMTQLADTFAPVSITKDGFSVGNMTSVDVDGNGYVHATFDTGVTRTIYQVPLVVLPNPNGMVSLDSQTFQPSVDSGSFFLWDAGDGPTGDIVSYAREESTTDVANELTSMIQTQRAYSSNAKVIQTVDEMLQETTNIKR